MIDQNEAAKYGITYFGRKGFEIQDNGRLVHVFNKYATPQENYNDALAYAKEREVFQRAAQPMTSEVTA